MSEFVALGSKDVKVGQKAINMDLVAVAEYTSEEPCTVILTFYDGRRTVLTGLAAEQVAAWIRDRASNSAVASL